MMMESWKTNGKTEEKWKRYQIFLDMKIQMTSLNRRKIFNEISLKPRENRQQSGPKNPVPNTAEVRQNSCILTQGLRKCFKTKQGATPGFNGPPYMSFCEQMTVLE